MDCPRVRYPQLNDVVEADLSEQGYQVLTDPGQQVDKVIQLYEVSPLALQELPGCMSFAVLHWWHSTAARCMHLQQIRSSCTEHVRS